MLLPSGLSTVTDAINLINDILNTSELKPTSPPSIVDEPTHFELAIHGTGAPKLTISGNFATTPINIKLRYWELSSLRVELDVGYFGRGSEDVNVTWGLVHKIFDGKAGNPHAGDDPTGMLYSDNLFLTATPVLNPSPTNDPNDKRPPDVIHEHPGIPHFDKFTARLKLDVGSGAHYATVKGWHFYLTAIHLAAMPESGRVSVPPTDHTATPPKHD